MTLHRHKPIRGSRGGCVSNKIRWPTRQAAEDALARLIAMNTPRHTERRVYDCDRCGAFHLTSSPDEEE